MKTTTYQNVDFVVGNHPTKGPFVLDPRLQQNTGSQRALVYFRHLNEFTYVYLEMFTQTVQDASKPQLSLSPISEIKLYVSALPSHLHGLAPTEAHNVFSWVDPEDIARHTIEEVSEHLRGIEPIPRCMQSSKPPVLPSRPLIGRHPHCHRCKRGLSSIKFPECTTCNWILCSCNGCGCNHPRWCVATKRMRPAHYLSVTSSFSNQ